MNVLPIIGLATVALAYVGATNRTDAQFSNRPQVELTSYAATPHLSVDAVMERTPQSVDQPFCDSTDKVTDTLSADFAETKQQTWVQGTDMTLQLWGSDVMGTWTLVHVAQDGIACVVSSGTGWTTGAVPADVMSLANVANS